MTITNRKKNPSQFDSNKHYFPNAKPLPGVEWRQVEGKDGAVSKKVTAIEVLACPVQVSPKLYVSRLKNNYNQAEWCIH